MKQVLALAVILLTTGHIAMAEQVTDDFDRADTTVVGTMSTAGYEWREGVNGTSYDTEQDFVITSNALGASRVAGGTSADYRDTIMPAVVGGGVMQAANGRIKMQLKNAYGPGAIGNGDGFVINYRAIDTDVRIDTDPDTAGNQNGSQFWYSGRGAYHMAYIGSGGNLEIYLMYVSPTGATSYMGTVALAAVNHPNFPSDPWIELTFVGDTHTVTLYENNGSTVYLTMTRTHNGSMDPGYIGIAAILDGSLNEIPGDMAFDNFELEVIYPANCEEARARGFGLIADLNSDCVVEWADFGIFAGQWQQCTDPQDPTCDAPWLLNQ